MRVIWLLGDQMHETHPALAAADRRQDRVLFIESRKRSEQVKYHQIKLVLIFAAMRHRAGVLRREGWQVDYLELTDSYLGGLRQFIAEYHPEAIWVQDPSQYNISHGMPELGRKLGAPIKVFPENQFLTPREEFVEWAVDKNRLLMENHYRRLRKKLGILIEQDGEPTGGAWNFDVENRETFASLRKSKMPIPPPPREKPDKITREVIAMVKKEFADHPGDAENFWLPVTRVGALRWLDHFIKGRLENFGRWEDVMQEGQPVLFHSVISPLLNVGLLDPRECIQAAIDAYDAGRAPLPAVEGFVRQIVGWREFINGVYWLRMPEYPKLNALGATRPLPKWIYTGKTEMNCLHHALRQVIELAYNHHIQRLMVLGNFFLLGGFAPTEVLRWYTEMYTDAQDWVMAANVIGMILHADGGYMATKPYAAGAGYINRMSNYCAGCRYDPNQRLGPDACPFNYLYWNFYAEHRDRFAQNQRVGMMIKTWDKKPTAEQKQIREQAREFLESL